MNTGPVVAVTGATGFLGLHLVKALVHDGARVRVLTRRDPAHELWHDLALEVVRGRLEDTAALEQLVSGADAVVHAAGLIKARDRGEFLRANRDGTMAMAQTARRHAPDARFVAVSSITAREPRISDYAASKQAGEEAARGAYADTPDRLVIARPPAIYGPWDRGSLAIFKTASHRIVPVFGSGRIAIIHVSDAAAAIARLAMGAGEAGTYTLADPNPTGYRMAELLTEAARALGNSPHFLQVPDRALLAAGTMSAWGGRLRGHAPIFTTGKAREMLHPDWSVPAHEALPATIHRPSVGLTEGFRGTVAWYRSAGWLG